MNVALRRTPTLLVAALCLASPTLAQEAGEVLWTTDIDALSGMSQPRVSADGAIYIHTNNLYAISPAGEILWSVPLPDTNYVDVGPDGTVYAGSEDTIFAFEPDGSLKWSFTEDPDGQGIMVGPTVGPDGNIYAVTDFGGLGALALDPDGQLLWNVPDFGNFQGTGLGAVQFGPANLYFAEELMPLEDGCTELNDGLASVTFGGNLDWCLAISGTSRVVATLDGKALIWQSDFQGRTLFAYDAAGDEVWRHVFALSPTGINTVGVGDDNNIYLWHDLTTLAALNTDGDLLWEEDQDFDGIFPERPVVDAQSEALVTGSGHSLGVNGEILAFDPANGQPLWSVPIDAEVAGTGAPAAFSPDGQVVYVPVSTASFEVPNELWAIQVHDAPPGSDLEVTLKPTNPPVEIPPGGGSYEYTLSVTNSSQETRMFDIWQTLERGATRRDLGRLRRALGPGATFVRTLTQRIPGGAPPGLYTHAAAVGSFPVAEDTDSFTVEKLAAQ